LTVRSRHVGGRRDYKTIAQREREHNTFFVLYYVKQLRDCRSITTEDSRE
jgi:hypothetical protein